MERVIVYIDGFNLYYGMRAAGWQRYFWLDVQTLATNLLKPHQQLDQVNYYTAKVSPTHDDPHKPRRQIAYLEALGTLSKVKIVYGKYLQKPMNCRNCGTTWFVPEEKMTDVNISVDLMTDAFRDKFDSALLVSADSDLTGPVTAIRGMFSTKRVIVAFPPKRVSKDLRRRANGSFTIGRKKLADSQFPDNVARSDGFILQRPPTWR